MKLLMVSANLPRPAWGASARNYHLLKALARQHTVSLLVLVESAEANAFADISLLADFAYTVRTVPSTVFRGKRWHQLMSIARGKSYTFALYTLKEMQDALDTMLSHDHYDAVLFENSLTA
jgi:hypothetical protein